MSAYASLRDAVVQYIIQYNLRHEDGCPEDDTCACPLVQQIEAALHLADEEDAYREKHAEWVRASVGFVQMFMEAGVDCKNAVGLQGISEAACNAIDKLKIEREDGAQQIKELMLERECSLQSIHAHAYEADHAFAWAETIIEACKRTYNELTATSDLVICLRSKVDDLSSELETVSGCNEAGRNYYQDQCDRLQKEADASRRAAEERFAARFDRMREALEYIRNSAGFRCQECRVPGTWKELRNNGIDFYWCDEHVRIPRKAISKGASRYQPQAFVQNGWVEMAAKALDE